ncbi:MAG: hypothetical protein ACHQIG_10745 [Acidimicrobiia bacterium]
MTSGPRDLGTGGRVLVAALAVGSAGVLAGWMAATDHAATASSDATNTSPAASGSSSSGTSSQPSFGDQSPAIPGTRQAPVAVPDGRTGGS